MTCTESPTVYYILVVKGLLHSGHVINVELLKAHWDQFACYVAEETADIHASAHDTVDTDPVDITLASDHLIIMDPIN